MKRRTYIIVLSVVLLAVVAFFAYRQYQKVQAAAAKIFQTVALERGSLTATVGATGTVRTNQSTVLAWQTSGIVGQVNVQVGDKVNSGQELASIRTDTLPQNVILAAADLVTAQRNLDDLRNSQAAQAQAQLKLAEAQKQLDTAMKHRISKDYKAGDQDAIDLAWADYIRAQNAVEDMERIWEYFKNRDPEDESRAEVLAQLARARQTRDTALANYNYLRSKPDRLDVNQAEAELQVARAQLADAQREWERLKNGPDPQDIAAAEARVTAIQATLNLAHITAPFDGAITDVSVKPGDQVNPGSVAFRLDDFSHLLVDVQVSEVDINRVRVGQAVTLTFDAILGKEYQGKVTQVSGVGVPQGGVVNFTVTVELTNPDDAVKPGMTAAVNIVVDEVKDALLIPNRAVRLRDGQRVVYVLKNGLPVPQPIKLGASSDTQSVLAAGDLQEGDLIVLNPPAELQQGGPFMGTGN
jgi:HlyD family secretion protein